MDMIVLIFSAFITSSISAVLGMGGGIILLGIMAIIIPDGYMVVALHGMVQLVSNVTRSFVFRKHIKKKIIINYFPAALLGLSVSVIIIIILIQFFNVNSVNEIKVDFLKPLIGIFILWFLYGKRISTMNDNPNFFKVGALSGLCTTFIGATGPLIAPFFLKGQLTKENIIANKALCQAISHLGKMPIFLFIFHFNYIAEIKIILPLILAVFIGTNIGKKILYYIPESVFRILFKGSLTIIAIKLVVDQLLIINFN